jgi:hypothetical protein
MNCGPFRGPSAVQKSQLKNELRTVLRTVRLSSKMTCGPSTMNSRTVRHQTFRTETELNQTFKTLPNSKIDQTNSKNSQTLGIRLPQHHEHIPKRSRPKDQSFMIKSTKFEAQMGFSPKRDFRVISRSNSILRKVSP